MKLKAVEVRDGTANVLWENDEGGNHRRGYGPEDRAAFQAEVDGAADYIKALGWDTRTRPPGPTKAELAEIAAKLAADDERMQAEAYLKETQKFLDLKTETGAAIPADVLAGRRAARAVLGI